MRAVVIFAVWCLVLGGRALAANEHLAHEPHAAQIDAVGATTQLVSRRGGEAPDARVLVAVLPALVAIAIPPRPALPALVRASIAYREVWSSTRRARGPPIA